jgi:hypothetical protein
MGFSQDTLKCFEHATGTSAPLLTHAAQRRMNLECRRGGGSCPQGTEHVHDAKLSRGTHMLSGAGL